jgi:uncharacterized membrane protein
VLHLEVCILNFAFLRFARLGIAFLAATWLMLMATAPGARLGVPISGLVYAFGSLICHQRPERSFYVGVAQLPVCARCYGLYMGAAVGAIAMAAFAGFVRGSRGQTPDRLRLYLIVAALPTAITWLAEAAGVWASSNVIRFVAALPLGMAAALTVNYLQCAQPQRNESRHPPTPI